MYIAHVRETDKAKQTLKDHLIGASRIAEAHGAKLGLKHVAGLAGVLHDLGKFSDEFQDYLDKAVFHPELAEKKEVKSTTLRQEANFYLACFIIRKIRSTKSFLPKLLETPSFHIILICKTISLLR